MKQNAKQADPDLFKFSDGSLIRLSQIEYLDVKPDVSFHQIISDIRNLDIANDVYEEEILADIIVCRAFKKLEEILKISRETVKKPHKLIILKGKNAQSEINNVSLGSNYSYKLENSITDHDSKIIIVDVK